MNSVSCYCGILAANNSVFFICSLCQRKVHLGCQTVRSPSLLHGDVLFEFVCQTCSPTGIEQYSRVNLQWLQVVKLALYNLQLKGVGNRRGFFRWKEHICEFIDSHWHTLFGEERPLHQSWIGSVTGALSLGCPKHFISGQQELQENGWWKLTVNKPPALEPGQIRCGKKRGRGKAKRGSRKAANFDRIADMQLLNYQPVFQSSDISTKSEIDSDCDLDIDVSCLSSDDLISSELLMDSLPAMEDLLTAFGSYTDGSSDVLNDERKINATQWLEVPLPDVGSEDVVETATLASDNYTNVTKSLFDDMNFAEDHANDCYSQEVGNQSVNISDTNSELKADKKTRKRKAIQKEENNLMSNFKPVDRFVRITSYEEHQLLVKLQQADCYLTPELRRLRAKLRVQQLKRQHGLPIFDLDEFIEKRSNPENVLPVLKREDVNLSSEFDKQDEKVQTLPNTDASSAAVVLDRYMVKCDFKQTSRPMAFITRLMGSDTTVLEPVCSPYTGRMLKPFIRRDHECCPRKLQLMMELLSYFHKKDPSLVIPARAPIDYCYVRPQHIASANALCHEFFWPGIDLSECLQYPDFSCVALYRKLVIGFAFLVPDVNYRYNEAYLSFIFTHPEWRRAGIARFMLYHLIQMSGGRDITLHVSVNNPSLLLYQEFGFKPEELVLDFYDKYFPITSVECRHAFYLRLHQ